jgi:hypothetical protein
MVRIAPIQIASGLFLESLRQAPVRGSWFKFHGMTNRESLHENYRTNPSTDRKQRIGVIKFKDEPVK